MAILKKTGKLHVYIRPCWSNRKSFCLPNLGCIVHIVWLDQYAMVKKVLGMHHLSVNWKHFSFELRKIVCASFLIIILVSSAYTSNMQVKKRLYKLKYHKNTLLTAKSTGQWQITYRSSSKPPSAHVVTDSLCCGHCTGKLAQVNNLTTSLLYTLQNNVSDYFSNKVDSIYNKLLYFLHHVKFLYSIKFSGLCF